MKRALFVLLSLTVLAGLSGCLHHQACCPTDPCGALPGSCASAPDTCGACGTGSGCGCNALGGADIWDGCGTCGLGRHGTNFTPGPPTGAVTYPYYTVRGPRDFLASDPRPIGP